MQSYFFKAIILYVQKCLTTFKLFWLKRYFSIQKYLSEISRLKKKKICSHYGFFCYLQRTRKRIILYLSLQLQFFYVLKYIIVYKTFTHHVVYRCRVYMLLLLIICIDLLAIFLMYITKTNQLFANFCQKHNYF